MFSERFGHAWLFLILLLTLGNDRCYSLLSAAWPVARFAGFAASRRLLRRPSPAAISTSRSRVLRVSSERLNSCVAALAAEDSPECVGLLARGGRHRLDLGVDSVVVTANILGFRELTQHQRAAQSLLRLLSNLLAYLFFALAHAGEVELLRPRVARVEVGLVLEDVVDFVLDQDRRVLDRRIARPVLETAVLVRVQGGVFFAAFWMSSRTRSRRASTSRSPRRPPWRSASSARPASLP